jgi:hypothetical protein
MFSFHLEYVYLKGDPLKNCDGTQRFQVTPSVQFKLLFKGDGDEHELIKNVCSLPTL